MITNERLDFLWNFCCWILVLGFDYTLKQDGISEHWRLVQRLLARKGCECGKCNI